MACCVVIALSVINAFKILLVVLMCFTIAIVIYFLSLANMSVYKPVVLLTVDVINQTDTKTVQSNCQRNQLKIVYSLSLQFSNVAH